MVSLVDDEAGDNISHACGKDCISSGYGGAYAVYTGGEVEVGRGAYGERGGYMVRAYIGAGGKY
jgi:hypothetical protein